jgi:alpha-mannosidase
LSAVKQSEQGDWLIVRFHNPTSDSVEAILRTFQPIRRAQEVTLNEELLAELQPATTCSVALTVGGWQVRTLALELGPA